MRLKELAQLLRRKAGQECHVEFIVVFKGGEHDGKLVAMSIRPETAEQALRALKVPPVKSINDGTCAECGQPWPCAESRIPLSTAVKHRRKA